MYLHDLHKYSMANGNPLKMLHGMESLLQNRLPRWVDMEVNLLVFWKNCEVYLEGVLNNEIKM